ncbi:efflux RND transporter periplasmic adaptor subunit [Endozoicomonas ascidiicola]|uniref:efflux RND transporter periplasmic adaptor subunit n=1 Tax=Endozoicomonas ascidiicola TaxID=1698521 RepID=UPI00082DF3B1|nr:efflux RND transporter periplasmic adaptor subunit [Endozoicomonas ascidiicola]
MKIKSWALTGLALGSVIVTMGGFKFFEISSAIARVEVMPEHSESVNTTTGSPQPFQSSIKVIGNVIVPDHTTLSSELPGRLAMVNFTSGAQVNRNDIIAQLDIATEKANLQSATSRRKLAQTVYDRIKQLNSKKVASQEQLDKAYADLMVIKAEVDVLNDTIRKKTIKAPFDGVLGIHTLKVGSFLNSNTELVSITGNNGYVWVDFQVPQFYPRLSEGTELEVSPIFQKNDHSSLSATSTVATVVAIDDALTRNNRTLKYRAKVEVPAQQLQANTAVNVQVPVSEITTALSIPDVAVLNSQYGQYVYQVQETESGLRAKRQPVTVISSDGTNSFISEGLSDTDIIATNGAFKLYDGIKVNKVNVAELEATQEPNNNSQWN